MPVCDNCKNWNDEFENDFDVLIEKYGQNFIVDKLTTDLSYILKPVITNISDKLGLSPVDNSVDNVDKYNDQIDLGKPQKVSKDHIDKIKSAAKIAKDNAKELIIENPSNLDTNEYNKLVNALNDMPNNGVVMPVNVEIEKRDQSTTKILQNEIKGKTIKDIKFDEDCKLTIIFDDGAECVIVNTMYEGIDINIYNDKNKRI
jgi:hypothetical protein